MVWGLGAIPCIDPTFTAQRLWGVYYQSVDQLVVIFALSHKSLAGDIKRRQEVILGKTHLERVVIEACFNTGSEALVRDRDREHRRFKNLHSESMAVRAQPFYCVTAIFVPVLQCRELAMAGIFEFLQPRGLLVFYQFQS